MRALTFKKSRSKRSACSDLVEEGGFEPPKRNATDLQSAPFGHSGTPPYEIVGAGGRIRTPDLLITNQLLYRLSYTSNSRVLSNSRCYFTRKRTSCQQLFSNFSFFFFCLSSGLSARLHSGGAAVYSNAKEVVRHENVRDLRPAPSPAGRAAGGSGRPVPPVRGGAVPGGPDAPAGRTAGVRAVREPSAS